jgi:hypothetical protein
VLRKCSPAGESIWTHSQAAPGNSQEPLLALAPEDGCYLAATEALSSNVTGVAISRIDREGLVRWRTIIITNGIPAGRIWAMKAVGASGIGVAGQDGTNAFAAVIDDDGKVRWRDRIGGSSLFRQLAVVPDGGLVLQGSEQVNWEPVRVLLARYGPDGERLWMKSIQQEYSARLCGVAIDTQTNIVAVWVGVNLVFATKLDLSGTELWTTKHSDYLYSGTMCLDAKNNLWFAGSAFYWGYQEDYRLLKIDPHGRILALRHHEGTTLEDLGINSIAAAANGDIYVGGGPRFNIIKYRSPSGPAQLNLASNPASSREAAIELAGDPGFSYTIESSSDLRDWSHWTNVVNPGGKVLLKGVMRGPELFYRAVKNP